MNTSLVLAVTILLLMLVLFVSNRLRLDLVAIMGLLALALTGLVTTREALAGFADPVVLMIAGLFVVGAGLFQTGVADAVGRQVEAISGRSLAGLTTVMMLVTAVLSAFLSSTGTVAVMLPVVLAIARRRQISPSLLLIPVAYAALLGGMLTLIGTPPNLVVTAQLQQAGVEPFGFFSFTLPGLVMLAVGLLYVLLFGPWLLVERKPAHAEPGHPAGTDLFAQYGLDQQLQQLRVPEGSPLAAADVSTSELRSRFGVTVLAIVSTTSKGRFVRKAEANTMIRSHDDLFVIGTESAVAEVVERFGLRMVERRAELPAPLLLVDAVVPPRSALIGRTLRELRLHSGSGVTVLAQHAGGSQDLFLNLDRPLEAGDTMLLTGAVRALKRIAHPRRDLLLLVDLQTEVPEDLQDAVSERAHLAPVALGIMLAMMLVMTFGWLDNVMAVLLAAVALILTRCVSVEEAYRSINWEAVVLIAAILPMATALDKTGGLALATDALMGAAGQHGPLVLMAVLFLFTAGLSQIISNTATTVLVAPIALQAALALGSNPYAMLMVVAIAASSAFATPVSSPVNTLVFAPGGYRFTDFLRFGVPLQVLILIATLVAVPILFPL